MIDRSLSKIRHEDPKTTDKQTEKPQTVVPSIPQTEKVKEPIQGKKIKQEVQPVMRQNKHMKDISPKREIKET